ncbi:hypothetical protein Ahy_A10g047660 [Arachis hypogaea]|uniref:Uncharacterized protein n=1 Tax=Arachis hypogaea TaxID=3818 RepID=A0A445B368_ARAHY|nr:hypothetical protein Ahy_A10g047660 [Arachis hypogaea]
MQTDIVPLAFDNLIMQNILDKHNPPSSTDLLAISANCLTLSLLSSQSASFSSINFSIPILISSFLTNTPISSSFPHTIELSAPTFTPTLSTLTTNFSFRNWSANNGHVSIGTPAHIASKLEFQPQCVKNPPIEGCDSISS